MSAQLWMTVLMAGSPGLPLFLIGTLDSPFRGDVPVGPDALAMAYRQLMRDR